MLLYRSIVYLFILIYVSQFWWQQLVQHDFPTNTDRDRGLMRTTYPKRWASSVQLNLHQLRFLRDTHMNPSLPDQRIWILIRSWVSHDDSVPHPIWSIRSEEQAARSPYREHKKVYLWARSLRLVVAYLPIWVVLMRMEFINSLDSNLFPGRFNPPNSPKILLTFNKESGRDLVLAKTVAGDTRVRACIFRT